MEIQAWRHASTNSPSQLKPLSGARGVNVFIILTTYSHHQVPQQTHPGCCDSESDIHLWTLMAKWQWSDRLPVV